MISFWIPSVYHTMQRWIPTSAIWFRVHLLSRVSSLRFRLEFQNRRADISPCLPFDTVLTPSVSPPHCLRLEGQTETGRRQWGGIWSSPRPASIVRHAPDVVTQLTSRFSRWSDSSEAPENRLPWINTGYFPIGTQMEFVLTTTADSSFWGSLITRPSGWKHSPWMRHFATQSGNVLYWIKEEEWDASYDYMREIGVEG